MEGSSNVELGPWCVYPGTVHCIYIVRRRKGVKPSKYPLCTGWICGLSGDTKYCSPMKRRHVKYCSPQMYIYITQALTHTIKKRE